MNPVHTLHTTYSTLPQISVEHVTKVITQASLQTTILHDITFAIPTGTLFAINGPSGCGKSTLLNLLTGIDRPTSGRILFSSKEIQSLNENQFAQWRAKHVGIVFQFFQLLPTLTALENVLMALELGKNIPRQHWHDQASECLRSVGMDAYANRLPSELSGGQQQRVAIARALANNPPVIVADEPTGNLDSKTALQVFQILETLTTYNKTVVYVTHDSELASRATHRIHMLDGRLVNEGNFTPIKKPF